MFISTFISSLLDNRRLDEWVEIDRFDLGHKVEEQSSREVPRVTQDLTDGTDRKITRNQKRKHDEINHVQKVFILRIRYIYLSISSCI